ncbi:hypothetical protein [Cellulomonas composti]|uniref:Uncharacterized protein n=1 Tax=Cellulomonas composti TaxID=266130 RepID=A0A511JA66_9CELL|nr:hypothetical protein [Cellulomonas composti]GEL94864.1 hypothetical protein CCO02nite_15220 [Cellulomonas composti]
MSMSIPLPRLLLEIPDAHAADFASGKVLLMGGALTTRLVDAHTKQVVSGARIVPTSGVHIESVPAREAGAAQAVARAAQGHPLVTAGVVVLVLASGMTWYVLHRRGRAAQRAEAELSLGAEMALADANLVVDAELGRLRSAASHTRREGAPNRAR